MLKAFIRFSDGTLSQSTDAVTLLKALDDPGAKFWLDMRDPVDHEIELLAEVFRFHPLAIEDSINYAQRPKIERYSNDDGSSYYYMVFHGPDLRTFRDKLRTKEMDMFMSDRFLVTMHDEEFGSINEVLKRADEDPRRIIDEGIDRLLYVILDKITDHYQPILDYLESELNELEDEALDRPRTDVLQRIAMKKRELLDLRRIVGPQREVVAQLARGEVPLVRESTRLYFRDVQDHLIRVVEMVELYRDLVTGARDLYLSSISNNLNQVMKTLTIISVIGMPLTIITGFFGMNFEYLPGIHDHRAFWAACVFMGVIVGFMLWIFRRKNWI